MADTGNWLGMHPKSGSNLVRACLLEWKEGSVKVRVTAPPPSASLSRQAHKVFSQATLFLFCHDSPGHLSVIEPMNKPACEQDKGFLLSSDVQSETMHMELIQQTNICVSEMKQISK